MKKLTLMLAAVLGIAAISTAKDKRTLIEKIKDYKNVRVYVIMDPIGHDPGTRGSSFYSGCQKFGETTEFTREYKDMVDELISKLNEELTVGDALTTADASSLPTQTNFGVTSRDWSKTGEEYFAVLTISGLYKSVANSMDKTIDNQLTISSQLDFFQMDGDKVKKDESTGLGTVASESKSGTECKDHAYFKENFPMNALLDDFKSQYNDKLDKFIEKRLKKYKKATK